MFIEEKAKHWIGWIKVRDSRHFIHEMFKWQKKSVFGNGSVNLNDNGQPCLTYALRLKQIVIIV
jgi:hypothetical protein